MQIIYDDISFVLVNYTLFLVIDLNWLTHLLECKYK